MRNNVKLDCIPAQSGSIEVFRRDAAKCQSHIYTNEREIMSGPPSTVESLKAVAFAPGREMHSAEYKAGVRAILDWRINGAPLTVPYALGTAQADANFAGQEEGKAIWRSLRESD